MHLGIEPVDRRADRGELRQIPGSSAASLAESRLISAGHAWGSFCRGHLGDWASWRTGKARARRTTGRGRFIGKPFREIKEKH